MEEVNNSLEENIAVAESPEVVEEAQAVSQEQTVEESASAPEAQEIDEAKSKNKINEEINFKRLREKALQLEKERDEAIKHAQALQATSQQPDIDEELEDVEMNPDDLVEGKHLSKFNKKIKNLEGQLNDYKQQSAATAIESKLKSEYLDFDSVVTKDNVDALRLTYPELARTIQSSPDLYSKAVSAYTLIKRLGIFQEDTFQGDKGLAHKNANKPKPTTSITPQQGQTPLSRANAFANGLTPELKDQLYKEMIDAAKRS